MSYVTGDIETISGYLESLFNKHYDNRTNIELLETSPITSGYISNTAPSTGLYSYIVPYTGVSARLYLDTYNNSNVYGSSYRGRRFRGTVDYPSGVLKDDVLVQLVGDGYSESGNIENATASLVFYAAEDFRSGQHGSYIRLRTTPTGGNTQIERIVIDSEGNIGLNHNSPIYRLDVSGAANFSDGVYVNGALLSPSGGGSSNICTGSGNFTLGIATNVVHMKKGDIPVLYNNSDYSSLYISNNVEGGRLNCVDINNNKFQIQDFLGLKKTHIFLPNTTTTMAIIGTTATH